MSRDTSLIRFEDVSYDFGHTKPILIEASFVIRRGSKTTLMGQNGAGKSTIFKLITGVEKPHDGEIHRAPRTSIAISKQVIPRADLELTVRDFFQKCFEQHVYDIDPRIDKVLDAVNLVGIKNIYERVMKSFSGGQQARLLLASALIQNPDLLLLDEPTNNLDKAGIAHLTEFLKAYEKTMVVISHDAEFLNSFTQGVIYLDVHTHKVEQYNGNYFDVLREITARVEKENIKNAQLEKTIAASKEKMNFFAQKGGKMRLVAKKMRTKIEEAEEDVVDVRREDKTIKTFTIPAQEDLSGPILHITSYTTLKDHKPKKHTKEIILKKNQHLLLSGPNGIGKSTLLESLARGEAEGAVIQKGIRVGYYRQDFSNLDFDSTVYQELARAMKVELEEKLRATAAGFLITPDMIHTKIGHLSEGQKGLVALARLVLLKPGLLILDEPTNHMNFRHLPVIAKALDTYEGAMILVSHVPEFVKQIRIDETLDLGK